MNRALETPDRIKSLISSYYSRRVEELGSIEEMIRTQDFYSLETLFSSGEGKLWRL